LAGQGVNLGLADAAVLASLLIEATDTGSDIGSSSILEAYEHSQKASNHATMLALDALKSVFALPPLLSVVRTAALNTLDHFHPAKKILVNWATGSSLNNYDFKQDHKEAFNPNCNYI